MTAESTTRAVLTEDGRVLIEQPDGSFRPAQDRTDWKRVRAMTDEEVTAATRDDSDSQPLDDAFWRTARVLEPPVVGKKHTRPAHR